MLCSKMDSIISTSTLYALTMGFTSKMGRVDYGLYETSSSVITSGSEVRCYSEAFKTLFAYPAFFHSFNPTSMSFLEAVGRQVHHIVLPCQNVQRTGR
jgi:hypothetical protein